MARTPSAMRSFLPIAVVTVLAVVVAATMLAPWLRQADPEWIAHADAGTASVVGRVLDENGAPVPGVELIWYAEAATFSEAGLRAFSGGGIRTTADATGNYRFDSLATDTGYIAVDEAKSKHAGCTGEFEPRKGFDARLDVEVRAVPTTRFLRGKLSTADGQPAEPRTVYVEASTWLTKWQGVATSNADGSFEILLPWECEEVELSWAPFDGSSPPSKKVRVRVSAELTVRVVDPK